MCQSCIDSCLLTKIAGEIDQRDIFLMLVINLPLFLICVILAAVIDKDDLVFDSLQNFAGGLTKHTHISFFVITWCH